MAFIDIFNDNKYRQGGSKYGFEPFSEFGDKWSHIHMMNHVGTNGPILLSKAKYMIIEAFTTIWGYTQLCGTVILENGWQIMAENDVIFQLKKT